MEALELCEQFKGDVEQYEMQMEEFGQISLRNKEKLGKPSKPIPSPLFN